MNKKTIKTRLESEGISEIDEITYKNDFYIIDSIYEFDKVEIEAATVLANENYKDDKDDTWFEEHYGPYLYDVAADNLEEVIDEICEEEGLFADITLCEIDRNSSNKCGVIIIFSKNEFDIEKVLSDIEE